MDLKPQPEKGAHKDYIPSQPLVVSSLKECSSTPNSKSSEIPRTAPGGPSPPLITSVQAWQPNEIRRQKEKEKKGVG
jgi:hypothetical protein